MFYMFYYITRSPTCWPALLRHCHGWLHHTQPPWALSNNCWLSLLPHHCVCSLCLGCFFLSLLCTGHGHKWAEETKQALVDWWVFQFCAKWILFSVSDFAKKTGDYRHLSATDISVLALTYMLEKQHVGVDHINTEPVRKVGSLRVFVFKGRAVDVSFSL